MSDPFATLPRPLAFIGYLAIVTACGVGIAIFRLAEPGPAERTLTLHGVYDEFGHFLTALMIAIGFRALRLPIPVLSVLIGGTILDLGHIVNWLELAEPIAGSSRNGSHSVALVVVLALVGFLDRRHANLWLGITLGAITHLWRDMGTGLVPLAWPASDQLWGTSFTRYMVGLLGVTLALIGSGALLEVHANATSERPHQS